MAVSSAVSETLWLLFFCPWLRLYRNCVSFLLDFKVRGGDFMTPPEVEEIAATSSARGFPKAASLSIFFC